MAVAIVSMQYISGDGTTGTAIVIPSATRGNGNCLVLFLVYDNASARTFSFTNAGTALTANGGAWSELSPQVVPSDRFALHGINNIPAQTGTVTATVSAASGFRTGVLVELSGADLSAPFAAANLITQAIPGAGANALTVSDDPAPSTVGLILGFFANESQHGQIAAASVGWTDQGTFISYNNASGSGAHNDAANDVARLVSKAYSGSGSQAATATATVSGQSDLYANFVVFIKEAAAGGSTTTKVMTETLTLTDPQFQWRRLPRLMSEAVSLIDPAVQWKRCVRVMSEALVLIDAFSKNVITSGQTITTKVMSEAMTLADGFVDWLRRVRQQTETIVISEDGISRAFIITGSETIDVTDELIKWKRLVRSMSDTPALTDGFTDWLRRVRQQTDTILITEDGLNRMFIVTAEETVTLSDSIVSWRRLRRLLTENIDVIDGFSKTLAGLNIVYTKVMSDTVTVIDDAGRRWTRRTSQLTDTVGLSDALLKALARIRILGDNIEYQDGVVTIRRTIKVTGEDLVLGDEAIRTLMADQLYTVNITFGSKSLFQFGGR